MFAGIRAETPVLRVEVGGGSGRYRHDEKVRADRGLVPRAIEEALRWETPLLTVTPLVREGTQAISFGSGIRKCLGMQPARMEMRVLLNAVLDRLPRLRLDPDAEDVHIHGLVFRSPPNLPAVFEASR